MHFPAWCLRLVMTRKKLVFLARCWSVFWIQQESEGTNESYPRTFLSILYTYIYIYMCSFFWLLVIYRGCFRVQVCWTFLIAHSFWDVHKRYSSSSNELPTVGSSPAIRSPSFPRKNMLLLLMLIPKLCWWSTHYSSMSEILRLAKCLVLECCRGKKKTPFVIMCSY